MRRRTILRDIMGTGAVFIALVVFTFIVMYGEQFLDRFKAH